MNNDQCQKYEPVSSVFEIASLPLDLKLYLTEFFTCSEAAKVLTVSQLFHDIFSRAVWHRIRAYRINRSNRLIPESAFEHYGHLTQFLDIDTAYCSVDDLVRWMPKTSTVKYGTQYYKPTPVYLEELEKLGGFGNMQRLCLYMTDFDLSRTKKVIEWLNDYSRSGHVRIVYMRIELTHAASGLWQYITRRINDLRRVRADLTLNCYGPIVEKDIVQATAATTVRLVSHKQSNKNCLSVDLGVMFGDWTLSFPWLKYLELVVCCADREKYDFIGFTPDRFPCLRELDYRQQDLECCKEHGCPARQIFSNQWLSITHLTLLDTISSDDAAYILDAVPKLTHLIYWCVKTGEEAEGVGYDLGVLAIKLPLLQRLQVMEQNTIQFSPSNEAIGLVGYQNMRLHHLELDYLDISEEVIRFIFQGCPVLRKLDIETCTISQDMLQYAMDISKSTPSSVRIYSLSALFEDSVDGGTIDFAAAFINLETFYIKYLTVADKKIVMAQYPHLKFI